MSWFRNAYRQLPTSKDIEYATGFVLGAQMVHDKAQQLQDIDLRRGDQTVSVKFQVRAAETDNFSFEMLGIDSSTGETVDGNFRKCQAAFIALVVPNPEVIGEYLIYGFHVKTLHAAVEKHVHRKVRLTPNVKATNSGRRYDDTESWLVRVGDLRELATITRFSFNKLQGNPAYQQYCTNNRHRRAA